MNNLKETKEKVARLLIGKKIRRLREEQAWPQDRLADKARVDKRTIQRLEDGTTARGNTLQMIAEAFKIPVTEFTVTNLDNGRLFQIDLPELQALKDDLNEFLETKKINHEEYQEMQTLIETFEKKKIESALPSLPSAPEGVVEPVPDELEKPLERLDLISTIKRVLTETTPWVKYAPVDKNNPSVAHKLRERVFISQPYFCNLGGFRVGFFREGFSSPGALYLAISRNETNEGLVVKLWPTFDGFWLSTLLYRSMKNNEGLFEINLRDFEIRVKPWNYYLDGRAQVYTDLLNATMSSKPNFVLWDTGYINALVYRVRSKYRDYSDYDPERLINARELPPIHIPWNIGLGSSSIHLVYVHPIEPMWFRQYFGWTKVELGLGSHYDTKGQHQNDSHLTVTWPRFFKFRAKVLSFWSHSKYKNCLDRKEIDLIALTDNPVAEQKTT
jgi:transcriptional regulator with XRE-family HTH domain